MKKLLPIILAAVMLLAALTACSEPNNIDATEIPSSNTTAAPMDAVKSTPEPGIKTTAEPTEKPTKDPTVSTVHYNKKECDALRKFFDAPSGVEGLSNGKLLNPDYVSEDPSTWCNSEEGRAGNAISIEWTDDGHVSRLAIGVFFPNPIRFPLAVN